MRVLFLEGLRFFGGGGGGGGAGGGWRYETGMKELEAWSRTGKALGLSEAKRLLQIVSHGSFESIISCIILQDLRLVL